MHDLLLQLQAKLVEFQQVFESKHEFPSESLDMSRLGETQIVPSSGSFMTGDQMQVTICRIEKLPVVIKGSGPSTIAKYQTLHSKLLFLTLISSNKMRGKIFCFRKNCW